MTARRLFSFLILLGAMVAPIASAFGQAPPAIAALPDQERRTAYSITGSQCVCALNFAVFGDGTDIDSWVQIWVNGTRYLSSDANFGWSLSSTTGPLSTIPRPITNAILTFNSAQTGTVQIVGARRPRQLSQFTENRGVAARDLNQRFTDVQAVERELWDKTSDLTGRGLFFAPGNTTGPMPSAAACASAALGFDATGLNPICFQLLSTGTLATPSMTVAGDVVTWGGTNGRSISDGGLPGAPVFNVVKQYGAKCDGVTNDTAAFSAAITAAIAAHGSVYFPFTGSNCVGVVNIANLNGLRLFSDAANGASIVAPVNNNALSVTGSSGSGSVTNIVIENLRFVASGSGTACYLENLLLFQLRNVICSSGGMGVDVEGTGEGSLVNLQAIGYPALTIGNGLGTLSNSGPLTFIAPYINAPGGGSPALVISGDPLGVLFSNCFIEANGGTQAASVTLDGPSSGTPTGSVDFDQCHGESNYNTSNTGEDFLVGATHKFGHVGFYGGNYWGLGNGTNYQRDWLRVVAARDIVVEGVTVSKLSSTNGYSRSMIRLESGAPDSHRLASLRADISGTLYSDANGLIASSYTGDAEANFLASSNFSFNLGSDATGDTYYRNSSGVLARLAVGSSHQFIGNSGGILAWAQPAFTDISGTCTTAQGCLGLTSAAVGDIIYASATTPTWSRLADVAVGSILISGGVNTAPSWSNIPVVGNGSATHHLRSMAVLVDLVLARSTR